MLVDDMTVILFFLESSDALFYFFLIRPRNIVWEIEM